MNQRLNSLIEDEIDQFFHEAELSALLQAAKVPYILKIWRVHYQKTEKIQDRLLMEYCESGHLLRYLRKEVDIVN